MRKIFLTRGLGVLVLIATVIACDRSVTESELAAGVGPRHSVARDAGTVTVLKRTTPLPEDLVASAIISSQGGSIRIPEAGLKVIFPAGAVDQDTRITVTAYAGDLVAYEFEPHGIVFGATVRAEQALQDTEASRRTDFSDGRRGYFSDREAIRWDNGTATVEELEPVEFLRSRSGNKIKFYIDHFSGYLLGIG